MKTTTEMQLVPIAKLVPYVNNARTHSPEQITKLRSSLREFGFINPVIIDRDFNVIAGHGRILAAKEEGIAEVPCVFADHLSEAQKKAYIIADNRMAMDAGWDEELLRVEIESLQGMDFDPLLTGFDEKELADLFGTDDEAKEDDFDVEAELEKPRSLAVLRNLRNGGWCDEDNDRNAACPDCQTGTLCEQRPHPLPGADHETPLVPPRVRLYQSRHHRPGV